MQRGNAVKALRSDFSKTEREERLALAASLEDGPGEPLIGGRQSIDPANAGSSFFGAGGNIIGTGLGLRQPHFSDSGEGPPPRVPAFWSPKTDAKAILGLITGSWLNVLLVLAPLGYLAHRLEWGATTVFSLNFFGIIPLALILGEVTEDLALRSGEVIGGLVNATFGNVVELILSCVALTKKKRALNDVAGLSNLGSILSNLLLVLGCCFLFGGCFHRVQSFNALANQVCNSLLFLAVVGLSLPCAAGVLPTTHFDESDMLTFSRIISVLLLLVYLGYLYFQLVSHQDLFKAGAAVPKMEGGAGGVIEEETEEGDEEDGSEDEEQPALTITAELGVLAIISIIVAMASELITDSIQDMAKSSGLTTEFLSIVLLPLAGNAVEHITAVMVAMKNKMDLALGIAIGSSIQIALFVLPTCVLFSWTIGNNFTLQLDALGTIALAVAIIHANFITAGGRSHYLMGVQLICTYLLISSAFLFTAADHKCKVRGDALRVKAQGTKDKTEPGVGLKAAWYGAEVFGKLFGRADSGSSAEQAEASTSGRPALSWDELKAGIREDYDNNYFVSGCADMAVYDPQCEFADPFVSFKGVDRFKQNLANFGNLTEDVKVDVLEFEELGDKQLKVGWRFSCILKLPWKPVLAAAGNTTYVADKATGLVTRHIEAWDADPKEVVKRLLKPSTKTPTTDVERFMASVASGDSLRAWRIAINGLTMFSLPVVGVSLACKAATGEGLPGPVLGSIEGLAWLFVALGVATKGYVVATGQPSGK